MLSVIALLVSLIALVFNFLMYRELKKEPRSEAQQSEAQIIEEWKAEMQKHPVGSPKHRAFANRLKSLGVSGY